ncbi:hypothetical protein SERLA73DRAFT_162262 [Serpula lacrymans var. lacrymans S7.3]|uniref:RWD domain-containing protein n=2 Tax=Serpula lacrymans var. lacrymans TaxID=341189 RepID=F8Q5M6_SERL3|nr:uncharacterized protein SERLADRAFT_417362 [Serpula lacrymans var. lacrymans S7.9]EGN96497.1 hypothetical protein SERLA73DRAFT_162262 [Serpula lacrymans var. lacrymans S7.3]EGO22045.1 hypothetical protein SERLADRAFT_417362 [Serpula lacrymans var. lacrymans S7.9]
METTEELQQLEIIALKSIYDCDFFGVTSTQSLTAARLPEFIIKVPHPDPAHGLNIYFHLHTKFPNIYPTLALACPTFTIQKPIKDLNNEYESSLAKAMHAEAQQLRGSEMVFQERRQKAERQYSDPQAALQRLPISPGLQYYAMSMLVPGKKTHVSCPSLLADLAAMSFHSTATSRTPSITVSGLKAPMYSSHTHSSSPEKDYFRTPAGTRQASRWKEDWEELTSSHFIIINFDFNVGERGIRISRQSSNKIDSRIYAVKEVRLFAGPPPDNFLTNTTTGTIYMNARRALAEINLRLPRNAANEHSDRFLRFLSSRQKSLATVTISGNHSEMPEC